MLPEFQATPTISNTQYAQGNIQSLNSEELKKLDGSMLIHKGIVLVCALAMATAVITSMGISAGSIPPGQLSALCKGLGGAGAVIGFAATMHGSAQSLDQQARLNKTTGKTLEENTMITAKEKDLQQSSNQLWNMLLCGTVIGAALVLYSENQRRNSPLMKPNIPLS